MFSIFSQIPIWQKHLLIAMFLLIISYGIFFPALKYKFVADDDELIVEREEYLKNASNFKDIFFQQFFVQTRDNLPYYRPIINLGYIIDYHIWGLKPFGFHLTNLLLHAINSILVYFLLFFITKRISLSLGSAFLFALHPSHIGTVAWIAGRTDSIATIFSLASFIMLLCYSRKGKSKWILIIASLFFTLALFSKETAIVLPILFLILLWIKDRKLIRKYIISLLFCFGSPFLIYL